MKGIHFMLVALAIVACGGKSDTDTTVTPPTPSKPEAPAADDGWELVWEDNFDGTAINSANWARVRYGTPDWQNMMAPNRADLAYIENGELVLLGKVNDHSGSETTAYVTGGVQTEGKKYFKLARFEVRAKFNCAQGFWPAIWLMPNANVQWPKGGEIDIMEHLNSENKVYQTIHSYYTQYVNKNTSHSVEKGIRRLDWNTYAVEIWEDKICMFVNDEKTYTYSKMEGVEYQWPFADYSYYLILSNQLGGEWVGEITASQLPSELRIDWVRVYQRKN